MSETPERKPCIQKRIKMWLQGNLYSPVSLPIITFFAFIVTYIIMEILTTLNILLFSYTYFLGKLDYSKAKDIVELIVTTDASIFAFTGVTATMILKHVLEEEKEEAKIGYAAIAGKNGSQSVTIDYRKKRREIIKFIEGALLILFGNIFFGLGTLITQDFVFTMLLSITLLLTSIIEITVMIRYALM